MLKKSRKYVNKINNSRVYDVAIRSPITKAENLSSNLKNKIFIKTDVKDLFNYMDFTISSNLNFKTIEKKDFNYSESFNPIKFKTDREKYVIVNQLDIYEKIYIKI